jgi:hypothetical protein
MKKFVGAGGTPGGVVEFTMGMAMACTGLYLVLNQVTVTSRFFLPWFGSSQNAFGPIFAVFLLGLCFIFFNGKSALGWLLCFLGTGATAWGVVSNLEIYFRSSSAINAFLMFGLVAAGVGLILKGLVAHDSQLRDHEADRDA